MLALIEVEALTCRGCGGWLPETTLKGNEYHWRPAQEPIRCHRCETLHTWQANVEDPHRSARIWPLEEVPS